MTRPWTAEQTGPNSVRVHLPGFVAVSAAVRDPTRWAVATLGAFAAPSVVAVALPPGAHSVDSLTLWTSAPSFGASFSVNPTVTGWEYAAGGAVSGPAAPIRVTASGKRKRYWWLEIEGVPEDWPSAPPWSPAPASPTRATQRVNIPGEYFAEPPAIMPPKLQLDKGGCSSGSLTVKLADLDGRLLQLFGGMADAGKGVSLTGLYLDDAGPVAAVGITGSLANGYAWAERETVSLSARAGVAPAYTYTITRELAGSRRDWLQRGTMYLGTPPYIMGRQVTWWEADDALDGGTPRAMFRGMVDGIGSADFVSWELRAVDVRGRVDAVPWAKRLQASPVEPIVDLSYYPDGVTAADTTRLSWITCPALPNVTGGGYSDQFVTLSHYGVAPLTTLEEQLADLIDHAASTDPDWDLPLLGWYFPRYVTARRLALWLSALPDGKGGVLPLRVRWDGERFQVERNAADTALFRWWIPLVLGSDILREYVRQTTHVLRRMGWSGLVQALYSAAARAVTPTGYISGGQSRYSWDQWQAIAFDPEPLPFQDAGLVGLARDHPRSDGTQSQDDLPATLASRGWDLWPATDAPEAQAYFRGAVTAGFDFIGWALHSGIVIRPYEVDRTNATGTYVDVLKYRPVEPNDNAYWGFHFPNSTSGFDVDARNVKELWVPQHWGHGGGYDWICTTLGNPQSVAESVPAAVARILHASGLGTNETAGYGWDTLPEPYGFAVPTADLDPGDLYSQALACPLRAWGAILPDEDDSPWQVVCERLALPAGYHLCHAADGRVRLRRLVRTLEHAADAWELTRSQVLTSAIPSRARLTEGPYSEIRYEWPDAYRPITASEGSGSPEALVIQAADVAKRSGAARTLKLSPMVDGTRAAIFAAGVDVLRILGLGTAELQVSVPEIDTNGLDWRECMPGDTVQCTDIPVSGSPRGERTWTGSGVVLSSRWRPADCSVELVLVDCLGDRRKGGFSWSGRIVNADTRYVWVERAAPLHVATSVAKTLSDGLAIGDKLRARWFDGILSPDDATTKTLLASTSPAAVKGVDVWRLDFGAGNVAASWFLSVDASPDASHFDVVGDQTGRFFTGVHVMSDDANAPSGTGYRVASAAFGGVVTTVTLSAPFAGALTAGAWVWTRWTHLIQAPYATATAAAQDYCHWADADWGIDADGLWIWPPPYPTLNGDTDLVFFWV